ncbi:SMP-LTD domain-containing protein [Plasmodiophora brassicae]|uniref:SMP-LTD domain-containing protein n=1 Tax=Plasmodiophora brassicae TaxID=37360 RepID=A0A3P3Y141_PLABS|nr:unnamed protein product [Plasmodiophora brassicae]
MVDGLSEVAGPSTTISPSAAPGKYSSGHLAALAFAAFAAGCLHVHLLLFAIIVVVALQIVPGGDDVDKADWSDADAGRPWVADHGEWINSFLSDVWPRHQHLLESRLRLALSTKMAALKSTGIHSVSLASFRIVRGRPRITKLLAHCIPAAPGGTSVRARPGPDLDHALDFELSYDGLVDIRFNVRLVVGSVVVRVRLTHVHSRARLRFYNRLADRPFFGGFTCELLSDPDPTLDFDVRVGYVDASKVPFVEEFILSHLYKIVRTTKLDFRLAPNVDEPPLPVFCPTGLLSVRVLGTHHNLSGVVGGAPDLQAVLASDMANVTFEMAVGTQTHTCTASASYTEKACVFIVSPFTITADGSSKRSSSDTESTLRLRVLVNGKLSWKGKTDIDDVFRSMEPSCIDWDVRMKRKQVGSIVRLRLLWEPLIPPTQASGPIVQKGLESWFRSRNASPRDIALPSEYAGIVRITIDSVTIDAIAADGWVPVVQVSLADQLRACTMDSAASAGRIVSQTADFSSVDCVVEFLVSIDAFVQSKVVLRVFDNRNLVGAVALDLSQLIFVDDGQFEGTLVVDNGAHATIVCSAEFHPSVFLVHVGQRNVFLSAPVQQSSRRRSSLSQQTRPETRPDDARWASTSQVPTAHTTPDTSVSPARRHSLPVALFASPPPNETLEQIVERTLEQIVTAAVQGSTLLSPHNGGTVISAAAAAAGGDDDDDDDGDDGTNGVRKANRRSPSVSQTVELSDMSSKGVGRRSRWSAKRRSGRDPTDPHGRHQQCAVM